MVVVLQCYSSKIGIPNLKSNLKVLDHRKTNCSAVSEGVNLSVKMQKETRKSLMGGTLFCYLTIIIFVAGKMLFYQQRPSRGAGIIYLNLLPSSSPFKKVQIILNRALFLPT